MHTTCVRRGIQMNTFLKWKHFRKFTKNIKKNSVLVPEKFVTFVKTVFYVSFGTFVWNFMFYFFSDFRLRINGLSAENNKHTCRNCVIGVQRDTFRLIVLLDFFVSKVFRLSAKIIRTCSRYMSAGCQNYNLFVSRIFLKVFNFHFFRRYFLLLFEKFRT